MRDRHIGLDLGDLGLHAVARFLHQGAGGGLDLADLGVLVDQRAAHPAHRGQIAHVIADVLNLQVVQHQPQPLQVLVRLFDELLLKDRLLLVDLLGRKLGDDATQVAFQRVFGDAHDAFARIAQEALDGVVQQRLFAGDLDVGDGVNLQRNAPA